MGPRARGLARSRLVGGRGALLGDRLRRDLGQVGAQRGAHVSLLARDGAELVKGIDLHDGVARGVNGGDEGGLLPRGLALLALDALPQRVRLNGARHPVAQHGHARGRVGGEVHVLLEHLPHARVIGDGRGGRLYQLVVGHAVGGAERARSDERHGGAHGCDREVGRDAVERRLRLLQQPAHGVVHQRAQARHVCALGVRAVPERGVAEVERRERVRQAAGDHLLALERAAEEQREVGGGGEGGGQPHQLRLVVRDGLGVHGGSGRNLARLRRGRGECGERRGDRAAHGADRGRDGVADHVFQLAREALGVVLGRERLHRVVQVRVRARHALPEDDERARQRVCALDRDADRRHVVAAVEQVVGPARDGRARHHVHRVRDRLARALGGLLLEHGREHSGRLVVVDHRGEQVGAGGAHERVAREPRKVLLHATHLGDGHAELLPQPRVGAHCHGGGGGAAGRASGQGDAAALGELLHQEEPAHARLVLPAEQRVHRDGHVGALHGAVHERVAGWVVAAADHKAGVGALEQRDGDALLARTLEQPLGVLQVEREADDAGDGREGNVALLERGDYL
mmetsp:Transcript_33517/g.83526  ORF Transcript_33517/g.83526 Transcript_33517/m.83526 type:complete len:573 (+) Transcript_33517:278-1996(+)